MDESEELLRRICRKYERITSRQMIGLGDIIRVLTGPDMIELMSELIELKQDEPSCPFGCDNCKPRAYPRF